MRYDVVCCVVCSLAFPRFFGASFLWASTAPWRILLRSVDRRLTPPLVADEVRLRVPRTKSQANVRFGFVGQIVHI